ncbi:MAG: hypothetical protein MSC31_09510 [Solirubrobacteraceae bacterium MAG38_C4-C5]|nr:hypothetical protein [Candidatus Siliceabacter maunaloa]
MSLLHPRRRIDPVVAARLRGWALERWTIPEEGSVSVQELECDKPGCPPRETVFVLARGPGETERHKVLKAAADVTRDDLEAL